MTKKAHRKTQSEPETSPTSQFGSFIAGLSPTQKWIGGGVIAVVLAFFLFGGSDERVVFLNGQRLSSEQLAYLDRLVGTEVPDGDYWYNPGAMMYGRVGYARPIGGAAYQMMPAPHWADVGQNYRGPFGDYMSDGQCGYQSGVPVGNC